MTAPVRRVNVPRDQLEELAWAHHTQIVIDEIHNTGTTRIGSVEYWAELGSVW